MRLGEPQGIRWPPGPLLVDGRTEFFPCWIVHLVGWLVLWVGFFGSFVVFIYALCIKIGISLLSKSPHFVQPFPREGREKR